MNKALKLVPLMATITCWHHRRKLLLSSLTEMECVNEIGTNFTKEEDAMEVVVCVVGLGLNMIDSNTMLRELKELD